jgi:polar amino acid transport system substrate-binding protein
MKKILVVVIVLVMALSFVACGKSGALKVAIDDTYPPMEYVNEDGELVGFDIDMAKALGKEMGVEIEFVSTGWDGIFAGLSVDQYDCIISSVSMTTDRLATMEFTTPYLANGQVIMVVPGDASIATMADLAGKNVGVQFQTTADAAADKALEEVSFEKIAFDDMTTCLTAMKAGQLDCIVADMAVAIDAVSNDPDKFVVSSVALTNEPIAIAVNKGNTKLVEDFNKALAALLANGTLTEISVKHLGADYVSNIDTELR